MSGRSYITDAHFTLAVGLMLTLAAVTTPLGRGHAAVLPIHFSECIGNRQACGHLRQVNIFNTEGTDPREAVDLSREKTLRPIARLIGTTASTFLLPLARLIGTTAFHLPEAYQVGTTAFLVSPCFALTSYHSVFGVGGRADKRIVTLIFPTAGTSDGSTAKQTMVTAVPEVWGEGHLASWVREDWVLLRLSECEGERIGWLDLADQDDSSLLSTPIAIAGYPSDKPRSQLWRDRTGHISRIGPAAFPDCLLSSAATRSGNSGSPLYQESSSSPAVVGLQVRVRADTPQVLTTYDESQAGFAVDVRHIAKRIGGLLSADKAVFWSKRPDMARKNPAHP